MPSQSILPTERIQRSIYFIRGERVMIDSELAFLYGVETGALNRAVKRNLDRFPADFMFQLTNAEAEGLRCQIGSSSFGYGGRRYLPYAFTEHGVAMLSSILRSPRAVQANIALSRVKPLLSLTPRFSACHYPQLFNDPLNESDSTQL